MNWMSLILLLLFMLEIPLLILVSDRRLENRK